MKNKGLTVSHIQDHLHNMGLEALDSAHYDTIIEQIALYSDTSRVLTQASLDPIQATIKSTFGGRQRLLKRALNHVLLYLEQVCQWQLPEQKAHVYRDHKHQWLVQVMKHAQLGGALFGHYQRAPWAERVKTLSACELISLLAIEVAPLPLATWLAVLRRDRSKSKGKGKGKKPRIEVIDDRLTLALWHPIKHKQQLLSFTRYALTPVAYVALQHYWRRRQPSHRVSEPALLAGLDDMVRALVPGNPLLARTYAKPITARQWHLAMQAIWHCKHQYPPELLFDMAVPSRHCAFHPVLPSKAHTREALKQLYVLPRHANSSGSVPSARKRGAQWPHRALLKRSKDEPRASLKAQLAAESPIEWPFDDVVPALMYLFTRELIVHGGAICPNLGHNTLYKYTGIYSKLPRPLSYLEASDPHKLDDWAKTAFESQENEAQQWLVYNFLRSVSQQALTDHLDVSQFECPTLPKNVDAYRLRTDHVHHAAHHLLESDHGTHLQRLCSAVALLLGFYGALRRGEVLRLRLQDVMRPSATGTQFRLNITQTLEGKTKNRQSRFVFVVMPESAANLVALLIQIKQSCAPHTPLIGFEGETLSSRERHYLYPVTQVLKALYGNQVRFHHLRHSGAHLLFLQGISLACDFHSHAHCDGMSEELLTKEACEARFAFWLEEKPFSQMNDGILLDVMSDQLGHRYYATTRQSYLHGAEWLPECFSHPKAYKICALQALLGKRTAAYLLSHPKVAKQLSQAPSGQDVVTLSQNMLIDALLTTPSGRRLRYYYAPDTPAIYGSNELVREWDNRALYNSYQTHYASARAKGVTALDWQTRELLTALQDGSERFSDISVFWQRCGQHRSFGLSNRQRTALCELGPITVTGARTFTVSFACNQKNSEAFNALFRSHLLACFDVSFHLAQNRKQPPERKLALIKRRYARGSEPITVETVPCGSSRFTVTFTFTLHSPLLFDFIIHSLT
ncbi:site-specific integrase [Vibrio rarus]|uniref:site-specific integrase n=1 Tax=Vibrio rarus TaxID=413403 RepID=UPI0021C490CB|nr:site-specific integrase [Vibrio rarus]